METNWTKHCIIEGVDCVGKTTLAHKICDELGFEYFHCGVPEGTGSLLEYYSTLLLRDKPTVFDRHFMGELTYGIVMRGHSRLSPDEMILIDRLVKATGSIVVTCAPPLSIVLERWQNIKRSEYVTDDEKFKEIWRLFMMNGARHGTYIDPDPYPNYSRVPLALLGRRQCPPDVIGSPHAKYLFVGERCNAKPDEFHLPFYSVDGSGGYLTRALHQVGYKEDEIAFTNALSVTGEIQDLRPKVRGPNAQQVIALGTVANEVLNQQNIDHHHVHHPAFIKRFRHNDGDWTATLRKIHKLSTLL